MKFDNFAGNASVVDTLKKMIKSERVANGILFEGDPGTGKTALAKIFANALVCRGTEKPCGICRDCTIFESGGHPDIINVTGTGKTGSISVETVREIAESAGILPNQSQYKVYFIDNADKMTVQAQNALLKILEEPPSYVVFILTCSSKFGLLPTILSRTQQFTLFPPEEQDAVSVLSRMFPSAESEKIEEAVRQKNCVIGAAAEMLSADSDETVYRSVRETAKILADGNEYKLMMCLSAFIRDRDRFKIYIKELKALFRDSLIKVSSAEIGTVYHDEALKISETSDVENIVSLINACDKAADMLERNVNYQLVLTLFGSELWTALHEV